VPEVPRRRREQGGWNMLKGTKLALQALGVAALTLIGVHQH
jgi:hypothetical protein